MPPTDDTSIRAETVIAEVDAQWGVTCGGCANALLGHDVVLSMLMGLRARPRCADCLAKGVGDSREAFLQRAHASIQRLACYRAGWTHSDRRLADAGAPWPEERLPSALRLDRRDVAGLEAGAQADVESEVEREFEALPVSLPEALPEALDRAAQPPVADEFDAGDMGCGDLVLELRQRLLALAPGAVLLLRASDPGAPGDIPAWCRVTRHALLRTTPPLYWIQRRHDA